MTSQEKIEKKLKELKPLLEKQFHIKSLGYFGSLSDDNFDSKSDVDLLIEFSEPLGWEFFQLKSFLEDQLKRPVDLVTKKALKEPIKESVLKKTKYL